MKLHEIREAYLRGTHQPDMSGVSKYEEKHCLRKRPYDTKKEVRAALLELWKRGRPERSFYRCKFCNKFHITSKPPGGIAKI